MHLPSMFDELFIWCLPLQVNLFCTHMRTHNLISYLHRCLRLICTTSWIV